MAELIMPMDNQDDAEKDDSPDHQNCGGGANQTLSLTNFLFGNIDASGELEGDVFDEECKKHLASLSRLGLGSLIRQVTDDGEDDDDSEEDDDDEGNQDDLDMRKSPSAIDYSDINEVVADEEYFADVDMGDKYDEKSDSELMPPPPARITESDLVYDFVPEPEEIENKRPTPLAAMLPSKYADIDVKEIFPDFRKNKVLRFSRLFAGEKGQGSNIWRNVMQKQKKKDCNGQGAHAEDDGIFTSGYLAESERTGFDLQFAETPALDLCAVDDEIKLCRPSETESSTVSNNNVNGDTWSSKKGPKEADWRFGPAQLWYDMLDVSPMGENFNYGFKLRTKLEDGYESYPSNPTLHRKLSGDSADIDIPDDAFHMVTQYNWEDDIIWNGDDIKHKTNQKRKNNSAAGWVPSCSTRTAQSFSQPGKTVPITPIGKGLKNKNLTVRVESDDTWYSIFPVENEELVYERWEDNIIWDPDNMDSIPEPNILTLDPNDENIMLGIPEDIDPSTINQGNEAPVKIKIPHPHVKKSKILLGKAGVITTNEDESPPPPPKSPDKDPFNLSNDEYYQPKTTEHTIKMKMGGGLLQHSTPVVELQSPFVATYMGEKKLRQFHRPPLKRYSHGPLSQQGPHSVHPLTKEIKKKSKFRENERLASGGGDVFFMRAPEDLTGKDGDIVMLEFCEEFPPLVSMVGMCLRMKNYYKRKAGHDKGPPQHAYGETAYSQASPYLGAMHPGQSIQTAETNMARAPLYEHTMPGTDFLVIRTRSGYTIREIDALFCSGQQCPLYEVPGPNSKRANNFIRDFLQVFIYRLFWKSVDDPRRIKMDEIKRAFPAHSESSIRKRLKPCADFKRTGADSNWWVIKPDFRLPTEDEIRAMVSPEQCCSFFSMLAAQQRLKDAGYGDKFLSAIEDDNDEDTQKLDDEIKVAPWHTSRAYMQAVKRKCLLQLTGAADPTGCGEGFSYIRIPNKPTQNKEEQEQQPKRTVTGTDADLRKLSLNNAKSLLRNYGVPEEEIKKLTRWEVIDVVRTLSTEKCKSGEEGMNKFSRGNRFSIAEHQERYKEECQRIFDLQNRVLASAEVLSTDEGSSSEEECDSDMEEKGKYIENILSNKKTSSQMTLEKEEQERKALHKMFMGDDEKDPDKKKNPKKEDDENSIYGFGNPGRVLKIVRTFRTPNGEKYVRTEYVRKTAVIDNYVKIRTTKDDSFIMDFAGQFDENKKEEIKRERRRLQEQLRRIKRNQERLEKGIITPPKAKKPKLKPDLKLKCGACGLVGHMRTNKACPMYATGFGATQPPSVASAEEQEPDTEADTFDEAEELINVDGTKLKIHSKVFKSAEGLNRKSNLMKVPKDKSAGGRRRRAGTIVHCDYLKKKHKAVNRRRIDPVVTLSTIFEEILNCMRDVYDARPFLLPVNIKQVPDYYNVIQHPMDLATIRDNVRQNRYQSREEFLGDISQIVENSKLYNGVNSTFTNTASNMLGLCIDRFSDKEDTLMRLERAINPLLDDNDQVAFDYILDNIVNMKMFSMQESWPFMKPVNKKNVKDYYEIIEHPMDLQTVAKKVKTHKYHSRKEFMHDMQLILTNSEKYNGVDSAFTQKARTLVQVCEESLAEYEAHIDCLEQKIAIAQKKAIEEAETDSFCMAGGPDDLYGEPGTSHMKDMEYYEDDDHENVSLPVVQETPKDEKKKAKKRPRSRKKDTTTVKKIKFDSKIQTTLEHDLNFSDDDDRALSDLYGQPINEELDIKPDIHELGLFTPDHHFQQDPMYAEMPPVMEAGVPEPIEDSTINKDLAVSESEDEMIEEPGNIFF